MLFRTALPLVALLVVVGCENGVTGPTGGGVLHVTKDCTGYTGQAGSSCAITASTLVDIAVGSRIVYATAVGPTLLDSDVVLTPAGQTANSANGHCLLNLATSVGRCTFSGGTGRFASFQADFDVSRLTGRQWALDGTYRYGR